MRGCRSIALSACIFALAAAARPPGFSQQTTAPTLHRRSAERNNSASDIVQRSTGDPSTLPVDVSGEYEFERLNETIEIDIHRNKLSGYISRLGDDETDSNTPLTFFFDKTSIDGSQIEFQTRVVHGIWYSFRGTIVRGRGKVREDEGYYVLHGVLLEHHPQSRTDKSADETFDRRIVDFKSMQR